MKTARCHIATGDYSRLLFSVFVSENWFWFVLPLALFAALGALDWRYFVVALMVLFIVIPMVMSLVYFNYMLTVETRWSIVDKTITIVSDGLLLEFDQEREQALVKWSDISGLYAKGAYLLVKLKVRRYQYLVIPVDAFESVDSCREFAKEISEKI